MHIGSHPINEGRTCCSNLQVSNRGISLVRQFICYIVSMPYARTLECHTAKLAIGQVGQQGRGNLNTSRRYVGDSETDVDDKRAR